MRFSFLLCFFLVLPVSAEVFTWVDENGKKYFSDKKPAHLKEVEQLEFKQHDVSVDQEKAQQRHQMKVLLSEAEKERQEQKQRQRKAQFELQKRRKLCGYAKESLAIHDRTAVTYTERPDGIREYFSKEQRNQRREKLVADIENYCR